MDCYSRRRRNRRHAAERQIRQGTSIFNGVCSFLVLASLIIITYHLLDYHCRLCKQRELDMYDITGTVKDLTQTLYTVRESYKDVEKRLMNITRNLSKIEQQISILDTLSNIMGKGDFDRDEKIHWHDSKINIVKVPNTTIIPYKSDVKKGFESDQTLTSKNIINGVF